MECLSLNRPWHFRQDPDNVGLVEGWHKTGFDFAADQILVSVGGKQAFYNLCMTLLNEGDEVIIPAPYWVSYPDMVKLADATPVIVEGDISQSFKITPEQLQQAITDKTKMVIINSPSKIFSNSSLYSIFFNFSIITKIGTTHFSIPKEVNPFVYLSIL